VAGNLNCAAFAVNYSKCKHTSTIPVWLYGFNKKDSHFSIFSIINVILGYTIFYTVPYGVVKKTSSI